KAAFPVSWKPAPEGVRAGLRGPHEGDMTDGRDHAPRRVRPLNRRQFLRAGGLAGLGLSLPQFLQARAATHAAVAGSPIRSCIVIFYFGGPSHLDTWDLKPAAPREVRGEFQ